MDVCFFVDLKSAYHHIDICEEHRKFLSFKWPCSDGVITFYECKVLPFGLTSDPYVFTKVVRQLVKYWRGRGVLILANLKCYYDQKNHLLFFFRF